MVPREVVRLDKRFIRSLVKAIRAVQSLFAMICSNYILFRAFQKIYALSRENPSRIVLLLRKI